MKNIYQMLTSEGKKQIRREKRESWGHSECKIPGAILGAAGIPRLSWLTPLESREWTFLVFIFLYVFIKCPGSWIPSPISSTDVKQAGVTGQIVLVARLERARTTADRVSIEGNAGNDTSSSES